MASNNEALTFSSYETALCVVLPSHLGGDVDRLRSMYDKGHGRWPPHINLIYPFVPPEMLPQALQLLQSTVAHRGKEGDNAIRLRLDRADFFAHKRSSTIYLTDSGSPGSQSLTQLRGDIASAFGAEHQEFGPLHLTIGQSDAGDLPQRQFLMDKVGLLPTIEWQVGDLVVLLRDRSQGLNTASCRMLISGTISLSGECSITLANSPPGVQNAVTASGRSTSPPNARPSPSLSDCQPGITYRYSQAENEGEEGKWLALPASSIPPLTLDERVASSVTVSTYNVLIDSLHPPPTERYPVLLQNLRSSAATADILVLQEVADDFLSCLLRDEEIRQRYPFATHGPPDQAEISPLTSLRNIVVLSRWGFRWEWLPFEKRHKGAVILQLDNVGTSQGSKFTPLVVTGVHLTCGLSDGSINAKRSQVQSILKHLSVKYPDNHWIVAGDFNITTSSYTLDLAVKRKSITPQAASTLTSLGTLLAEVGLSDCYFAGRAHSSGRDEWGAPPGKLDFGALYEGEEGATFDPTENELAARIAGSSYHSRPQRYDRIFVRGEAFQVSRFNMFGFPSGGPNETANDLGSDHWGIRAVMELNEPRTEAPAAQRPAINITQAMPSLGGLDRLKDCLSECEAFPSVEEIAQRKDVFDLIKGIVNQRDPNLPADSRVNLSFAVGPVGSYGLGVWNSSSDVDVLVIGQVSARTFFALMVAKLRKAVDSDVTILRKVKAASGTMLELEARGVRVDLQYCAATRVAESWPQALEMAPDDPMYDLPMQSLLKFNSLRDMHYLQRTIPDLASFRLAYRFIKLWAQRRGVYSSKLGYLGGIHITLLLSRVCKLAFEQDGTTSASDMICTFFKYYAQFQWERDLVYDPGFYKRAPRYFRTSREPITILTQHTPKVNVARSASLPSTRTLQQEFKRVDELLSQPDIKWADLIGSVADSSGVDEFFTSYPSYVKVNVQFWGAAATKGRMLVGWLEWRCVSLLVDIHRRFPDLHARIWPARFTADESTDEAANEYQGCYLIGLTKGDTPRVASTGNMDRQSAQIALLAVLNAFAEQIRGDERYFDSSSHWVDVSLVQQSALHGLHIDKSAWGNTVYDDGDAFDDDEDDIDLEEEEEEEEEGEGLPQPRHRTRGSGGVAGGAKLRPASDVLSRLRWDSSLDIDDYIIGYDDRFLGDREMPVSMWKAELTDEAFIPMHRILYFRRKTDGVRVWDRESRKDLLFSSGSGKPAE